MRQLILHEEDRCADCGCFLEVGAFCFSNGQEVFCHPCRRKAWREVFERKGKRPMRRTQ